MDSKLFTSLFLLISSCVYVGFSQGGGDASPSMPCVQKLLPCKAYLNSSLAPAPSCCVPLKEMITKDSNCLCEIFNNAQLLKTFNISQVDALKLPKACGATADISICKTAAAPIGPSSNSSGSSNSTGSPSSKSGANGMSLLGGSSFITFLVVLITSLF